MEPKWSPKVPPSLKIEPKWSLQGFKMEPEMAALMKNGLRFPSAPPPENMANERIANKA